jgi:hypothetical protein
MVRPRWHDAVIVLAIVAIILFGVYALWWDDVRTFLHLAPERGSGSGSGVVPVAAGHT